MLSLTLRGPPKKRRGLSLCLFFQARKRIYRNVTRIATKKDKIVGLSPLFFFCHLFYATPQFSSNFYATLFYATPLKSYATVLNATPVFQNFMPPLSYATPSYFTTLMPPP